MGKTEELVDKYVVEMEKYTSPPINRPLLDAIAHSIGPSLFDKDGSLVAAKDPEEVAYLRKHFLIEKLGLEDTPALDEAITEVAETMGVSNTHKYRVIFYALLVHKFGKEAVYGEEAANFGKSKEPKTKKEKIIAECIAQAADIGAEVSDELITAVANSLGPSLYNKDAQTVASSDEKEVGYVREKILIEKFGLEDTPALDEAIKEVIDIFGADNSHKRRVVFYALLAKKFSKEDIYLGEEEEEKAEEPPAKKQKTTYESDGTKTGDLIKKYFDILIDLEGDVNIDLLKAICSYLGPSLWNADGTLVAASQEHEVQYVKDKFLVDKLGLESSDELDTAMEEVFEKIGSSKQKHRAIVYYLLTTKYDKADVF